MAGAAALYLNDLDRVPFHPDESLYINLSRDFETVFLQLDWEALTWQPGEPVTHDVEYRLLSVSLARYPIGLAWKLAGFSAADLNNDWAWPQSWQTNVQNNALPSPRLLHVSRAAAALLGAATVGLVFWLGAAARGVSAGLLAAGVLGLSPLMLLHARRAMAESPLLFFSTLAVLAAWRLARWLDRQSRVEWKRALTCGLIAGAFAGLAASAKHSGLVVAVVSAGLLGLALWQKSRPRFPTLLSAWLGVLLGAGLLFVTLNPVMQRAPLPVARAMLEERLRLIDGQAATLQRLAPDQLLPAASQRLWATAKQLYLEAPAVWEVLLDEQRDYLEPQANAYFEQPLHRTWPPIGLLLAGLTGLGLAASAWRIQMDRLGKATRPEQALWLWAAATLGFIIITVPFNWQRYFLPLLPPASLFAALGTGQLVSLTQRWWPVWLNRHRELSPVQSDRLH